MILALCLVISVTPLTLSFHLSKVDLTQEESDLSGIVRLHDHAALILPLCPDHLSLTEASVLCRQINGKMAKTLTRYALPAALSKIIIVNNTKCYGHEDSIVECAESVRVAEVRECASRTVAGLRCVSALPNLVPDVAAVEGSVYLHLEPLHQLSCAIEESCVSPDAVLKYGGLTQQQLYALNDTADHWRKLLRFSSIISNKGEAVFEAVAVDDDWQWHTCHGHFHSMDNFATYQIFVHGTVSVDDRKGLLLAGHKASFCLEDNVCVSGVSPLFKCSREKGHKGTQGISPGCTDTYLHNIDCQWIDVTNLPYGRYLFRLVINPEILVAESNYHDNAIACELYYFSYYTALHYCHHVHPFTMW